MIKFKIEILSSVNNPVSIKFRNFGPLLAQKFNHKQFIHMRKLKFLLPLLFLIAVLQLKAQESIIIPQPQSMQVTAGAMQIPQTIAIYAPQNWGEASYFVDELKDQTGLNAEIVYKKSKAHLVINTNKKVLPKAEAYQLQIKPNKITLSGSDDAGVFYGLQSLIQLLNHAKASGKLQAQLIKDAPRFPWRAHLVDEGRYFKGEKEIYTILDEMAALKMNILHWHLTEDAGWRIEIKKYPQLTEVGAKRKDTQVGGWSSDNTSGEPHEGFYTQEDIKRILRYARERHIKVVPEIEMPGHASAAIAAYPWLGSKDEEIEVPVKFGKHYPTFNVANKRVQQFLKDVIDEVYELFETDVIHIGGDEVRFDHWEQNDEINALYKEKGFTSYMDVQIDFSNMMSRYIQEKGARMMGWNEILGKQLHNDDNISFSDPSQKVADNVVVHFWKGDPNEINRAVQNGYDIVNSHHIYTYLDYGYNSISLERAYNFEPILPEIPEEFHHKVIGIGCQMWSEWTPTILDTQRMTFPRIAALAEVAWTQPEVKNYNSFLQRINYFSDRWTRKGINFTPVEKAK